MPGFLFVVNSNVPNFHGDFSTQIFVNESKEFWHEFRVIFYPMIRLRHSDMLIRDLGDVYLRLSHLKIESISK